jgi:lysophospholipase L1-like esterase
MAWIVGLLTLGCCAAPSAAQFGDTPSPPPPFIPDWERGTFNRDALGGFFRAAAVGRVDIVCIGDSNQLLLGHGWDEAYIRVVSDRWGLYATGLVSGGENAGNGAGTGWTYQGLFPPPGNGFAFGGALSPLDPLFNAPALMQPLAPMSVIPGQGVNPNVNIGVLLNADCPLDVNAALRYWVAYASFAPGSGAWLRPSVRLADEPYSELARAAAPVNAATAVGGTPGIGLTSLDLPAATTPRGAVNFRPTVFGEAFSGPFTQYLGRVENTQRERGVSVHTLYALGGQSARDMGEALLATSDAGLSLYFSMVRQLQGPNKAVLVRIGTGVNDRSETLPSLGTPPVTPGNYPEAFKANLRAIIDRVRGIWTLNGWSQTELYFLIAPSTPIQGPPDDSLLQAYRDIADQLSLEVPRTAVTHFERLTSVRDLSANDWILYDVDTFHLEAPGHAEMARRELGSAGASAGWQDVNLDAEIDAEDLYAQHAISQNVSNAPGTVPAPREPTSRGLMRAVRWEEAGDLFTSR